MPFCAKICHIGSAAANHFPLANPTAYNGF